MGREVEGGVKCREKSVNGLNLSVSLDGGGDESE